MMIRAQLRRLAISILFAASPAFAQTLNPAPPIDSVPEKIAPGAGPAKPAQNLSEQLNPSNGVIHPKEVDPAIEKPAPKAGDPNVIPPPGAPGGSPAPQPK